MPKRTRLASLLLPLLTITLVGFATPPAWRVGHWYIDPLSILAVCSDNNSGTAPTAPLCDWRTLNDVRWNCAGLSNCPRLSQVTTVTWQSSGTVSDTVYARPGIEAGGPLVLTAALPTPRCSGTLSGVVPKTRTPPQLLTAVLCGSVQAGDLIVDTTHPSLAWAFSNVTGSTWTLSQTNTAYAVPITSFPTNHVVDVWANGDAFVDYPPGPSIYASVLTPTTAFNNTVAFTGALIVQHLTIAGQITSSNQTPADTLLTSAGTNFVESTVERVLQFGTTAKDSQSQFILNSNVYMASGGSTPPGITQIPNPYFVSGILGVHGGSNVSSLAAVTLDGDVIVAGGIPAGPGDGCHDDSQPTIQAMMFGSVYIDTSVRLNGSGPWEGYHSVVTGLHVLWGPGGWDVWGGGHLGYEAGQASTLFLNTGVTHLDCGTTACNGSATALPTTCNITINEANIASNGTLWVPGGASVGPLP